MGRRRRLAMDLLEGRELLSWTPFINSPSWVQAEAAGTGGGGGGGAGTGGQGGNGSNGGNQLAVDPATGIVVNSSLGGSGTTTDVAPPRGNEVRRRAFAASFAGRVQEEPPRLLDQSRQFFILAPGTTNQFLHGTVQLRYYTPNPTPIAVVDPATGATLTTIARATTGTISISDRSTQSGGVILANLTGSPAAEDPLGRPTRFALSLNGGGGSGGIYASSTGSGTVDIAYKGNRATVTVRASIFIQGVGQPLDIFQTSHH